MDQAALVDRDMAEGRRVVQALDRAAFPVVAALWVFVPEENDWRLLIASPDVTKLGPRGAYEAIQQALLQATIDLPLYRISAVPPEDPLVTELRIFAGTDAAPFLGGTTLRGTAVGDVYVEGAYVYRAERIVGTSGTVDLWAASPDRPHKVWTARRCKVVVEDGFIKRIEVERGDGPQRHARNGVNAHLAVLTNVEKRGDQTIGDVQRWTILAGRLRSIETVAKGVRIEGYSETASPSAAPG
jgi:hypothetical protein